MANKDFDLKNLPLEAQDASISSEDFVLTQIDKSVHEQKFATKPTTFLKDSLRRFAKNKSSVVAAAILGVLIAMSIIVPMASGYDVDNGNPTYKYLEPKMFESGTGWWDGTKQYTAMPVDTSAMPNATTEAEKQEYWWPNTDRYIQEAVSNKSFSGITFSSEKSIFGKDGYIQVGYNYKFSGEYVEFITKNFSEKYDVNVDSYLEAFTTFNEEKVNAKEETTEKNHLNLPENYVIADKVGVYFNYINSDLELVSIRITDEKELHDIGGTESRINISSKIKEAGVTETLIKSAYLSVRVNRKEHVSNDTNVCALLGSFVVSTESTNAKFKEQFEEVSFTDATKCINEETTKDVIIGQSVSKASNYAFWSTSGGTNAVYKIYASKIIYCSFLYDSYEAVFGVRNFKGIESNKINEYASKAKGWMSVRIRSKFVDGKYVLDEETFICKLTEKGKKSCPIVEDEDGYVIRPEEIEFTSATTYVVKNCKVAMYRYYGLSKMPKNIMGTDKTGRDMFTYVFKGLRTSLSLGVLTFLVCFIFGLAWGAIAGYFGGTVDLVMERITDILAGVPWVVVMTLVILKAGKSSFGTFALALCLTGWIGTAATTRTQFYRFRGREYVLASRTLGASDARLITRHILPNAMGTIITGAVLMIPSVIFQEATISYLGLGFKNLASLGVILSNNQSELYSSPYLLIFPSVIIALLMISFNLFGNGLRDAINPSLKGEGE